MNLSTLAAAGMAAIVAGAAFAAQPPAPPLPPSAVGATTRAEAEARARARFAAVDTDHDGYVTRAESQAAEQRLVADARRDSRDALARYFDMMDADHDGAVSRAEFDAFHAGRGLGPAAAAGAPARMMAMPAAGLGAGPEARGRLRPDAIDGAAIGAMFDAMDRDRDGRVSLAEAVDAARRRFDALDTNHDGTIDPAERRGGTRIMAMKRMGISPRAD